MTGVVESLVLVGIQAATGVSTLTLSASASALIQVAVGLGAAALAQQQLSDRTARPQERRRDLYFPSELPPYRFVYGETRATATVLPHPVIGDFGYGVYLLNSRPSVGTPAIFLDEREIPLTGDPYDFSGPGATPVAGDLAGYLNVWIGLGDQTGPPDDYVSEAPYDAVTQPLGFRSTDAGAGLTVVYLRYRAGPNGSISVRWPNVPPRLEVEGLKTAVWDMRDGGQDPDDETTWAGDNNHALVTLDAHRFNPFRPHDLKYVILSMWNAAADVADIAIPLAAGGTEPQFTIDGTVVFDGLELEQIVAPLFEAGAARRVNVGGKIGIAPGEFPGSVYSITSMIEGLRFSNMKQGRKLPTQIKTAYVSAPRGFTDAELALWDIPGVDVNEEPKVISQRLPYTTSATRAMRLRKIRGLRERGQRVLNTILPPDAADIVVGSGVTCALGAPYDAVIDGAYEVETSHLMAAPLGEDGRVALASPVKLAGTSPAIYAWTTGDEEPVFDPPYAVGVVPLQPPGAITATTGASVNASTGAEIIPRVRYESTPSPSAGVAYYQWQAKATTDADWGTLGDGAVPYLQVDQQGDVFTHVPGEAGVDQDFRWRAVDNQGNASNWVEKLAVAPVVTGTLDVPVIGSLTESPAGTVNVPVTTPNDAGAKGFDLYAGPDSDVANAGPLVATQYVAQNTTKTEAESGLGSAVTRYYFARSVGSFGIVSAWVSANITTA